MDLHHRVVHFGRWAAALIVTITVAGCPHPDLGAPCNHGRVEPEEKLVTFPALSCDSLICVYGESVDEPQDECEADADCNIPGTAQRFACVEGSCDLDPTYVLERSMCSQPCEADGDCADEDPDSTCETGFSCAVIQSLGEFCCQRLCVCRDDLSLADSADLTRRCEAGDVEQCERSVAP